MEIIVRAACNARQTNNDDDDSVTERRAEQNNARLCVKTDNFSVDLDMSPAGIVGWTLSVLLLLGYASLIGLWKFGRIHVRYVGAGQVLGRRGPEAPDVRPPLPPRPTNLAALRSPIRPENTAAVYEMDSDSVSFKSASYCVPVNVEAEAAEY